ncbi:MAG: hypothetical protein ABJB85_09760 [Nitrososphaerota archaeon]
MGIIAGLGSGATVIYLVVRKLGRYAVIKYGKYIFLDNKKLACLCRMAPGMRELISISAGLSSTNFLKFIVFTYAGSLIWNISLPL